MDCGCKNPSADFYKSAYRPKPLKKVNATLTKTPTARKNFVGQ